MSAAAAFSAQFLRGAVLAVVFSLPLLPLYIAPFAPFPFVSGKSAFIETITFLGLGPTLQAPRYDGPILWIGCAIFGAAMVATMTPALWRRWFAAWAAVSGIVSVIAFLQSAGFIAEPWNRPDATFGNPAILGAYLAIAVFIAIEVGAASPHPLCWGAVAGMDICALWETATRGAFVALLAGLGTWAITSSIGSTRTR